MRGPSCCAERVYFLILLAVLLISPGGFARAAEAVTLHLKSGDRVSGIILSETESSVVVSNVWNSALTVPVNQIAKREAVPAAPPAPASPAGQTPPRARSWRGEAQVGVDFREGASDQQTYFARFKLAYERSYAWDPKKFFRNGLDVMAEYGETTAAGESDSVRSSDRFSAIDKTSADIRRRWYAYSLVGGGYDHVKRIDAQYEAGPGAGYHVFTLTNFNMNAEAGLNYQAQYRDDGSVLQDFYYRVAEDFSWRIRKNVLLTERFEFFPRVNFSDYRIRFETTLSYDLLMNLALNLTVLDLYDTQPADGVSHNELQVRSSLGWKF